ncbi:aspartate aminotransferase family protein, partial [Rhizobiaceae bacterium]|nr:aspartate aminotransferase family protein [Rhizobiaceae bacterium]
MAWKNFTTEQLQRIDGAHHMHPFTDNAALREHGTRVITSADGAFIHDSEGKKILDGMAG